MGKCLIGMAQQDSEAAQEALMDVDPNDVKAIVALQNKARLGKMFTSYVNELFDRGETALKVFIQQRSSE